MKPCSLPPQTGRARIRVRFERAEARQAHSPPRRFAELSSCGQHGLAVKPRQGDALLFWSMTLDGNTVRRQRVRACDSCSRVLARIPRACTPAARSSAARNGQARALALRRCHRYSADACYDHALPATKWMRVGKISGV